MPWPIIAPPAPSPAPPNTSSHSINLHNSAAPPSTGGKLYGGLNFEAMLYPRGRIGSTFAISHIAANLHLQTVFIYSHVEIAIPPRPCQSRVSYLPFCSVRTAAPSAFTAAASGNRSAAANCDCFATSQQITTDLALHLSVHGDSTHRFELLQPPFQVLNFHS